MARQFGSGLRGGELVEWVDEMLRRGIARSAVA